MYGKIIVFVCIAACATASALPAATKEQLDKVTGADVAANAVVPTATNNDSKKADYVVVENASTEDKNKEEQPPASTIEISGIQTGYQTPASPLDPGTPFKPQRAGSMFARLIDDIFQLHYAALHTAHYRVIQSILNWSRLCPGKKQLYTPEFDQVTAYPYSEWFGSHGNYMEWQIPINVLQNVAKLITSPFNQNKNATPEPSGRY